MDDTKFAVEEEYKVRSREAVAIMTGVLHYMSSSTKQSPVTG